MKKYFLAIVSLFCLGYAHAQVVVPVPVTFQEHDQWCWAGCTSCILRYYGDTTEQCEIAEFTRSVSTWHYYGASPCCVNPMLGCNYPNMNYGATGSMQEILVHFGGLTNTGTGPLSLAQMDSSTAHYLPFIVYWQWMTGGGHFVVGNGVDTGHNVHYMNPWVGEGAHICTYSWMVYDGSHNYLGTNVLDHCPLPVIAGVISGASTVVVGAHITLTDTFSGGTWHCSNTHATVSATGVVTGVSTGWDTVMYTVTNACGTATAKWPVHITAATSGLGNIDETTGLEVYPNPNNGSFTIKLVTPANEAVHITVTNLIGSKVLELSATGNEPANILLDQPAGIYVLTATTKHGSYVSKIVVSR